MQKSIERWSILNEAALDCWVLSLSCPVSSIRTNRVSWTPGLQTTSLRSNTVDHGIATAVWNEIKVLLSNMMVLSLLQPFKFKIIKIWDKIIVLLPWWHVNCSVARCDDWVPYWTLWIKHIESSLDSTVSFKMAKKLLLMRAYTALSTSHSPCTDLLEKVCA